MNTYTSNLFIVLEKPYFCLNFMYTSHAIFHLFFNTFTEYLLQPCVRVKLLQLCLALCDSMDCSLPGCSALGILLGRILGWVAMSSSKASSRPRDQIHISCGYCTAGRFFTAEPPGKALNDPGTVQYQDEQDQCTPAHSKHTCQGLNLRAEYQGSAYTGEKCTQSKIRVSDRK